MKNKFAQLYKAVKNNLLNDRKLDLLYLKEINNYKGEKVNLGQLQAFFNSQKKSIKSLSEVEFQVFSQFGDDGIIQWLTKILPLPNKTFIEFGVENYREANTRFLLVNNYWSGLVMDGSKDNIDSLSREQLYTFYDLQALCAFIKKSNINQLISTAKFKKEVGILSIDIDGNDFWIWETISDIEPVIVITEYNSLFGFDQPYTIPYKDDFVRGRDYPFNFYGTSLLSAYDLGIKKGYAFIGTNSAGNNAYFIRREYMQYLPIPEITPEEGYTFSSFTEAWDSSGTPLRGIDKLRSINNLPVVNTRTGAFEKVDSDRIIQSLISTNKLSRL